MKEIKRTPIVVYPLSAIIDKDFVGIEWCSGNRSILITNQNGKIVGMNTTLTLMGVWESDSKKSYVEEAFRMQENIKAFIFDTKEELFKWLTEGNV